MLATSGNYYAYPPVTVVSTSATMRAVQITTTNVDVIEVYQSYIKASFTNAACSSTDISSKFNIYIDDVNPCINLNCLFNKIYAPNTAMGDVPPTSFTVVIGSGFSLMNFTDFRDKKTASCNGQTGNYKFGPTIMFQSPVCGEPVYQVISQATGFTIDN